MKIITWNVNWIRAVAKKWFKEFVEKENPDILCIQETKAFEDQFLKDKNLWELEWYKYVWHKWERAGYAGTVIFYKNELEIVSTKNDFGDILHFNADGRFTEIEFSYKWKNVVLMNWYFPNWWTRADGTEMVSYKLDFYTHLQEYTRKLLLEILIFVIQKLILLDQNKIKILYDFCLLKEKKFENLLMIEM